VEEEGLALTRTEAEVLLEEKTMQLEGEEILKGLAAPRKERP
jgi:hypothetical protein